MGESDKLTSHYSTGSIGHDRGTHTQETGSPGMGIQFRER